MAIRVPRLSVLETLQQLLSGLLLLERFVDESVADRVAHGGQKNCSSMASCCDSAMMRLFTMVSRPLA